MKEKVISVNILGEIRTREIEFDKFNEEIKPYIGDGESYYQVVSCSFLNHHFRKKGINCLLLLDDEGKLKRLPINHIATMFYANPNDIIVGDAVICTVEGDHFSGVPEEVIEYMKELTGNEL